MSNLLTISLIIFLALTFFLTAILIGIIGRSNNKFSQGLNKENKE